MKQKAGSMTRTAFTFAQLWLSRRYATKVDREVSTFNTRRASRTGTPSLRQGPATSSFAMRSDSVTWRLAPPCSCRCQVLKEKQKDNLRARATNEDGRKLQAVRFKIKEEMRPGHFSASSQPIQTYIHTYIHTFHLRSGCGCEAKSRKAAASSERCCAEPPQKSGLRSRLDTAVLTSTAMHL